MDDCCQRRISQKPVQFFRANVAFADDLTVLACQTKLKKFSVLSSDSVAEHSLKLTERNKTWSYNTIETA